MDKKSITFGETEVEKHKFLQHKTPMSIDDEDINKILVSNKVSFSFSCRKLEDAHHLYLFL